ncbi:MAG: OmpA family protein [Hyphomonas sp.]
MIRSIRLCLLAAIVAAPTAFAETSPPPENILSLSKGAVLLSASHDELRALALTDGDDRSSWSVSTRKAPPPHEFVFELIAPADLTHVGIDGAGPRPGGVSGGSAKGVTVEGSAEGPDSGYVALASFDAAPDGPTRVPVAPDNPVRWLRFTVHGTQDPSAAWLYFDEVIAEGEFDPPEDEARFSGIFRIGRSDLIELYQTGNLLRGCYVDNGGRSPGVLEGAVNDGVALLNWVSDEGVSGTAVLTRTAAGNIAGVRYRHKSRTPWGGPVATDAPPPRCAEASPGNAISEALESAGEARIYGILFNHDSDVPRSVSLPALNLLLEALQSDPGLAVEIEGHTDSDGSDPYNLDLSARRAAAIVAWLVERGIEPGRLNSSGKGESEPVASNDTADGKSLNRRVDVVKL